MKKILAALLLAALALTLCACGLIAQPEYTPIPSPTPAPADVDLFRVDMGGSEAEPTEETPAETVTEDRGGRADRRAGGHRSARGSRSPHSERGYERAG